MTGIIPSEHIAQKIYIKQQFSQILWVHVKRLNKQVKRNVDRFPEDFMFKLS